MQSFFLLNLNILEILLFHNPAQLLGEVSSSFAPVLCKSNLDSLIKLLFLFSPSILEGATELI